MPEPGGRAPERGVRRGGHSFAVDVCGRGAGSGRRQARGAGRRRGGEGAPQDKPDHRAEGQLLPKIIETMGLSRSRVYIANILKCRPDTPGKSSGNRKPTAVEMDT